MSNGPESSPGRNRSRLSHPKASRGGNVSEIALEARNLYKVFGKNPSTAVRRLKAGESRAAVADAGTAAVIDASFTVNRGEIFVIMGLSGSGKSTIIRMLNGLHDVTSGTVTVNGDPITGIPSSKLREIRRDASRWSSSTSPCCRTAPSPRTSPTRSS